MYTIEGTYTLEDYKLALKLHSRIKWLGVSSSSLVLYFVIAFTVVAVLFYTSVLHDFTILFPVGLLMILAIIAFIVYPPIRIRKIFHQQKVFQMPFRMDVSEEGVRIENSLGYGMRPWHFFIKF